MTLIDPEYLLRYWGNPTARAFYCHWTGPFLRALEVERQRRPSSPWPWDLSGAVEPTLDTAWQMTGAWRARRGVKVDEGSFLAKVPPIVRSLAGVLNDARIATLTDLSALYARDPDHGYVVLGEVHAAVLAASAIKPTAVVKPMFGSKVLHHYFPSVVPVFDTALVYNGVMASDDYHSFERHELFALDTVEYERQGDEVVRAREMTWFYDYLDYCRVRLAQTDPATLAAVRRAMGEVLAPGVFPTMRADPSSLLWHLDAKLAEWCFVGAWFGSSSD